jgi:hypothetical protein
MKSAGKDALTPGDRSIGDGSKSDVRRSTRLSRRIPVVITSLDPAHNFSGKYETAVVNAHGCAVVLPERLGKGTPVAVELFSSGRSKKATIVQVITIVEDASWLLGLEFDISADNFWEVDDPPADWLR